ncbi:MAG TPA: 5-bromo-4-chloroindolyl phosphate hydrolysis family protein [Spirochaetota bacterium]|nr:5-bromo-4-chloroindolyl phosphate hydrolysis family protein [Spirochaetota bacterium]HNT09457.1 5-bromo-4-chloroindolyl phosphate hydrolysis family protein [Spirochaetota bacterium]HNV45471.1 5-bromo-4-chloroindolyl phosphate hydrolysis family protein [Spirochaetota bacterium]HOS41279.1 5-bromo-4-chloroindolyl phosphate hydrolysis family protein [Spirochaetota bacterium]HPI22063.1 5-bromo-4-chloroindolyl phosphate hydrolysis family protein [Spirochaetota bacterium]
MTQSPKQKSSGWPRQLISLAIAGGVFAGLHVFLNIGIFVSLLAALGGYIAGLIIFRRRARPEGVEILSGGVSQSDLRATLAEGSRKLNEMRSYGMRIRNAEVKRKVYDICAVVERIYDNFKKDPKDIKAAKQFLSYYFDAVINILKRYVELSSQPVQSAEVKASLEKAEGILDSIHRAFEAQYDKLLRDDVLDLETEIKVLKNMITMEGLGGSAPSTEEKQS